jgi:hypothetical protein
VIHTPSFRDGPKDQTSDVQLQIGESKDSGFDALHRPGMTALAHSYDPLARNDGPKTLAVHETSERASRFLAKSPPGIEFSNAWV